jgi:hypothetical protein
MAGHARRQPLDPARIERWVEKQNIKVLLGGSCESYRIRAHNFQAPSHPQGSRIEPRSAARTLGESSTSTTARAARGGLETESAAASEQIQAGKAAQIVAEPVEQGFAHPIRRRPQTWEIGKAQQTPPPLPADDAYRIQGLGP